MTPRLGFAAAAALIIAVVGARILSRSNQAEYRGAGEVALVTPTGSRATTERRFTWRAFPTATSYELRVLSASGDSVYRVMTGDTTHVVPSNIPLVLGDDYVWSVHALVIGETRAASRSIRFRFRP